MDPLPIELTCDVNVSIPPSWRVNGTSYTIGQLDNEELQGHGHTGPNILVNSPVNNTEYICVLTALINGSATDVTSVPAYIIIAGEWYILYLYIL